MKRIVWLYVLLSVTVLNAQDYQLALGDIAEAESKSAIQRINQTRNLNTGNYDLKYHRLELTLDPNVAFLTGDVTSYFLAKENMSDITFELTNNMIVYSVKQRGIDLTFVQNIDDEVVINLPQIQHIGVLDSLTISYSGNPKIVIWVLLNKHTTMETQLFGHSQNLMEPKAGGLVNRI